MDSLQLLDADVLLESLLCDGDTFSHHSLDLSSSPTTSEEPTDNFPCIADELEEQAKQLEEDWFCPNQPPANAAKVQQHFRLTPSRLGMPALRHSGLDLLQRQMAAQLQEDEAEQEAAEQREQQQQQREGSGACADDEPCTPQRQSKESSWNESMLPAGLDLGEVQSPAPVSLMALPSTANCAASTSARRPPLQLAIHNAQCVRLGQEPALGAWRGCGRSAWCSEDPCHRGNCNMCAVMPGLLAYPAEELFESGVNIEELCRVPDELVGHLAPDTESEGEGTRPASLSDDCLSGKRRTAAEAAAADDGASHSQSDGSGGCTCSGSGSPMAVDGQEQQQQWRQHESSWDGQAAAKRIRVAVGACGPPSLQQTAFLAMAAAAAEAHSPRAASELDSSSSMAQLSLGLPSLAACPGMVPVALPFAPPVPSIGGGAAVSRNHGRPAGAPRLRPIQRPPAPPPAPAGAPAAAAGGAAAATPLPSKPVTRQLPRTPDGGAAAAVAPRPSGRKTILHWNTDSVVDPRTGLTVTVVEPGTFCTQCFALSTPVWRAGPFGHKTLCNACGVRWMKASKNSKK